MSGPVAVDATVKAMVELVTRASKDADFRRLCETDMEAAVADLETAPSDGARFEYTWNEGAYSLRIHRGGETTTISITADGLLTVDNDAMGFTAPDDDELSDIELMAVAGGTFVAGDCGCKDLSTKYQKHYCKSLCVCFNGSNTLSQWIGIEPCYAGAVICNGIRVDGAVSYIHQCDQYG